MGCYAAYAFRVSSKMGEVVNMRKKCPICGKPYNDYITHIWSHKEKTIKYLQAKRKEKGYAHSSTSKNMPKKVRSGLISKMRRLLDEYS